MTITEQNTNITYSTVANESGYYVFSNLKDGTYRVESELSGFKKTVRENIRVDVNQTVRQRNALLDGPSLVNLDATIAKLFALPRGARGEFRVDIFNLTNTPHFARPGGGFGSSTFGRITATEGGADMRSMRFGLKVTF